MKKRKKKERNNKYLYRPAEVDYYKDLYNGEYYIRIICYLI